LPQFNGTPTGSVTFRDGTRTLKTVTLSAGTAAYSTAALALGAHSITASYNGNDPQENRMRWVGCVAPKSI
jgi:hypothetical protein